MPVQEGVRYAVSLGGDTDTNAAVTGALLGALHGREALPGAWLEKLVDRQAIEAEAEALADVALV
jgi:ADP-ribosylglycohydrolase